MGGACVVCAVPGGWGWLAGGWFYRAGCGHVDGGTRTGCVPRHVRVSERAVAGAAGLFRARCSYGAAVKAHAFRDVLSAQYDIGSLIIFRGFVIEPGCVRGELGYRIRTSIAVVQMPLAKSARGRHLIAVACTRVHIPARAAGRHQLVLDTHTILETHVAAPARGKHKDEELSRARFPSVYGPRSCSIKPPRYQ